MPTFMDLWKAQNEYDRCGMKIKFNLPRTSFTDFRISFGNKFSKITREGIAAANQEISSYSIEVERQLCDAGYYLEKINDYFTSNCFYAYLKQNDMKKEYPRMKVYIHPNEFAGWAPKKEIEKLLCIAKENSYTLNEELVYSRKVYNISDNDYLAILKDAEPQIIEWLRSYQKLYRGKMISAPSAFNKVFGIKRISLKHLSYNDYVALNYISQLMETI